MGFWTQNGSDDEHFVTGVKKRQINLYSYLFICAKWFYLITTEIMAFSQEERQLLIDELQFPKDTEILAFDCEGDRFVK